jgi:hypothetical protein
MRIHIIDMLSYVEHCIRIGKKGKVIDIGPMRVCNDGTRFVESETPMVETSVWLRAVVDGIAYQGTAKVSVPLEIIK